MANKDYMADRALLQQAMHESLSEKTVEQLVDLKSFAIMNLHMPGSDNLMLEIEAHLNQFRACVDLNNKYDRMFDVIMAWKQQAVKAAKAAKAANPPDGDTSA